MTTEVENVKSGRGTVKGKPTSKTLKPSKNDENVSSGETSGKDGSDPAQKLKTVTAERDRYRSQRDEFGKQFEELSKLRSTDAEALFERYKEKASIAAKAQEDIIANQTALTVKLENKIKALEEKLKAAQKALIAESEVKPDPKEIKVLKERAEKAESVLKSRDDRISALEKDLKTETENSHKLLAARNAAVATPAAAPVTSEDAVKDAVCLRLYEDISELSIPSVKIKEDPKAGKEIFFNCIQTHAGKSLNFKLKTFNAVDKAKVKAKAANPWDKKVQYIPGDLDNETEEFVAGLGEFATEFTIDRDQIVDMFAVLKRRLGDE